MCPGLPDVHFKKFLFKNLCCHKRNHLKNFITVYFLIASVYTSRCCRKNTHGKDLSFMGIYTARCLKHCSFCSDTALAYFDEKFFWSPVPYITCKKHFGDIRCYGISTDFKKLYIHILMCTIIVTIYKSRFRCGINFSKQCTSYAAFYFCCSDCSSFCCSIHHSHLFCFGS